MSVCLHSHFHTPALQRLLSSPLFGDLSAPDSPPLASKVYRLGYLLTLELKYVTPAALSPLSIL